MTGFVYAIAAETGCVKIGWSGDPCRRLSKISSDSSSGVRLLGVVPATKDQEAEIHELLAPWRLRREWYRHEGIVAEFVAMLSAPRPRAVVVDLDAHPLRVWRHKNGRRLHHLAAELGVARTTVSRWETGRRKIEDQYLLAVSEKTGIPTSELRPDLAELMKP